jgi:putative ABC transport system permease protein
LTVEKVEESHHHRGGVSVYLADMGQDVRYALRTLRGRPTFLLAVVFALALGIGASTAIFTVVNSVLLRPLPFAEPHRLMYLIESKLPQFPEFSVAPGNFLEWQAQSSTFESMAAYGNRAFDLTGAGEPERFRGDRATVNLFSLLGVRPVIGRDFRPEEDTPGGPPVVLLSYGLWQRRFGGDRSVVGRVISLNGLNHTVVGIMPAAMQALRPDTALWVPMAFTERERQQYGSHFLRAIGRLKPGVSLAQAGADLETIARRLEAEHPEEDKGWRVLAAPLDRYYVRNVRPALLILLGAVGLVLLVACANVANLFLARGMGRQKELAIRSALGAGRARILRQLLTESVVLAIVGGSVGLGLAHWLLRALLALAPAALPRAANIGLDLPAVTFALALSTLTPLLFGLLPSLQVSRTDLSDALNAGGRTGHAGIRRRTRRALIITEIALATILLVGSSLLVRSFNRLQQVDPGFIPSQAVIANLALPERKYPEPADAYRFYHQLIERVSHLPGARAAGVTASLPFVSDYVGSVTIEGRPPVAPTDLPPTNYYSVSPDYFRAMGIRLLRGRLFTEQDGPGAPRVGIINETFPKRLFPGEDPIGKRVKVSMGHEEWQEVVGIVADTKHYSLTRDTTNQFYEPYGQLSFSIMTLVVRTDSTPAGVAPALRDAVRALDPDLPIGQLRALDDLLAQSIGPQRFSALLLGTFAASALFLAVIGLYGALAYAVGQRTLEIGVRMALGAQSGNVLWMFLREGLSLALAGAAVGLAGALVLTRLMTAMLFGIEPTDPATLTLAPLALVVVALLASLIPAYRAMRTNAVMALRGEQ